ncbi:MAG: hypothetical protein FWB87_15565 [Defluviitaleaceae bacterium]|nr:hypothetical protein [Defluviitaleaceae bacterium]
MMILFHELPAENYLKASKNPLVQRVCGALPVKRETRFELATLALASHSSKCL